jgi:hypothetical protein
MCELLSGLGLLFAFVAVRVDLACISRLCVFIRVILYVIVNALRCMNQIGICIAVLTTYPCLYVGLLLSPNRNTKRKGLFQCRYASVTVCHRSMHEWHIPL